MLTLAPPVVKPLCELCFLTKMQYFLTEMCHSLEISAIQNVKISHFGSISKSTTGTYPLPVVLDITKNYMETTSLAADGLICFKEVMKFIIAYF